MGRPLALDGRRLMGGHNNQPKVGIDGGRVIGEELQPGRNMWGGVSLQSGRQTEREKTIEKQHLGLRWPLTGKSNTTTNQKHACAEQEVKVRRFYQWGAEGVRFDRWGQSSWAGG